MNKYRLNKQMKTMPNEQIPNKRQKNILKCVPTQMKHVFIEGQIHSMQPDSLAIFTAAFLQNKDIFLMLMLWINLTKNSKKKIVK